MVDRDPLNAGTEHLLLLAEDRAVRHRLGLYRILQELPGAVAR